MEELILNFTDCRFGGGPVCSSLQYCVTCQNEFLRLQTKRNAELAAYKQLEKMARSRSVRWHHPPNLITRSWFARWERFVLNQDEGTSYSLPYIYPTSSVLNTRVFDGFVSC